MKNFLLMSLLALTFFAQANFAQPPKSVTTTPAVKQQSIEVLFVSKTLTNGLEVIVLRDASVPLATVELAVRNGSFTEPPELNGLSHLFEHMFFKPDEAIALYKCELAQKYGNAAYYNQANCTETAKLKSQIGNVAYLDDYDQLSVYNGRTQEEVVEYYFTTTSKYLTTAMRRINDAVRYPTFDEDEFAKEKEVVVGEIDRNEANPFFYLNRALNDKLFYEYPTRKNPLGTRETVRAATTDKMRLIQSRYYVPNNSAVVVTGDVNADEVFRLAEQIFGGWQRRAVDPFKEFPLVEHPPLPKSEGEIVQQPVNNVIINIGWQGPSIGKDDRSTYAADVFSYILTQPDSKFQRDLVDSGLATDLSINYYTQRNVGPIQILFRTSPEKAKAALETLYGEIAQFDKPDYFSDTELANAKTLLVAEDLFSREKSSDYTHTLAFWWSSTGVDYFRDYYNNLRSTTRADTNRYVKTYIQGKPHVGIALLSPASEATAKLTEQDLIGK
ncbi:MAG: M16 family metallopeptidase [Pyrinomonadaceae bacterium]